MSEPWHCFIHLYKLALMFCGFQALLSALSSSLSSSSSAAKGLEVGGQEMAVRQRLTTISENYWDTTGHTKEDASNAPVFSLKDISMFGLAFLLQNLIFNIEERKIKGKNTPRLFKCTVRFHKNVQNHFLFILIIPERTSTFA